MLSLLIYRSIKNQVNADPSVYDYRLLSVCCWRYFVIKGAALVPRSAKLIIRSTINRLCPESTTITIPIQRKYIRPHECHTQPGPYLGRWTALAKKILWQFRSEHSYNHHVFNGLHNSLEGGNCGTMHFFILQINIFIYFMVANSRIFYLFFLSLNSRRYI